VAPTLAPESRPHGHPPNVLGSHGPANGVAVYSTGNSTHIFPDILEENRAVKKIAVGLGYHVEQRLLEINSSISKALQLAHGFFIAGTEVSSDASALAILRESTRFCAPPRGAHAARVGVSPTYGRNFYRKEIFAPATATQQQLYMTLTRGGLGKRSWDVHVNKSCTKGA